MRQPERLETQAAEPNQLRLFRQATLWQAARLATPTAVLIAGLLTATPGQAQVPITPPAVPATTPAATPTTLPKVTSIDQSFEGLTIVRVEVAGNTRTDAKTILDQVRTQAGQNYHRPAVDQDVRTIAAMERFQTVRAEIVPTVDNQLVVRFVVQERALVTHVEIVGNHKKSDEKIREVTTISPGMGVDPFILQIDIKAIQELYRKSGYNFVKVTVDQKALDEQGIVRYKIEEGPKSRIWHVKFDGNDHMKARYLRWKIQTKSYIWIFRKGLLDEDKLELDVIKLRDLYVAKGWLDARVSRSVEYNADKTRINVRFAIVEGPRYKIGRILIGGNTVFNDAELRSDVVLNHDDWAERDRVETSTKHMEDRYGHEGYIYRKVDLKSTYAETPGVVDLHFEITENKSYTAGRIIVRGNSNIQDRVVRRQIRVYPDQTYDTVLIRKSMERLKATRLFSDVKITPVGDEATSRDVLVEVQEGQSGKFLIGAGISTNSGLIGQVSLEQQNFDISNLPNSAGEFFRGQSFKGAGQFFRILLEPGTEIQRYRITFEEPYMFDSPYSLNNDLYFFTRSRESWDEQRIGDIVTFGRRFGDVWGTGLGFRAEQVKIKNAQDYGNPGGYSTVVNPDGTTEQLGNSAVEVIDGLGTHPLTSIKPSISRDTTDSRIFPTNGNRTTFSWEQYGAMGGDTDMAKLVGRFDWYYTLYSDLFDRKTVLAQRNEIGVIPFGSSPFYERFYAGGIGSLRGFKYRGVGPRSGVLNDPIGGDFTWLSTVEINYPIYEEVVRGVVFTDIGTVEPDFGIDTIRSDIGLGLRLTIPFFGQLPLAVDCAIPLSKTSYDETQIVSFSMGIPF